MFYGQILEPLRRQHQQLGRDHELALGLDELGKDRPRPRPFRDLHHSPPDLAEETKGRSLEELGEAKVAAAS